MKPGFYTIMAAQFLSSLADNALLIAAIALLNEAHSADWLIPFLKLVFVVSYVLLAPFVGAFADAIPKGRVMFLTNAIKLLGCILLLGILPPLAAYALVGFGAAAYSPAKYGILTELLPPEKLVAANGWIEGTTVASIILGTVLGGVLISPHVAPWLLSFDLPVLDTHIDTPAEAAVMVIIGIYGAAALINLRIPDTGARYPERARHPLSLLQSFWRCNLTLWRDPLGQIALAVTTLFWGAGASLQFLVLKWAEHQLDMRLDQATRLQGIVALGVALGAVLAASWVPLKRSLRVLPLGAAMGVAVAAMSLVHNEILAMIVLLRGADERPAPASRLRGDERRPFHRRAELQREPQHPRDAAVLRADALAEPAHQPGDRAVRPHRVGHHGAGDDLAPPQPAPQRHRAPDRRRPAPRQRARGALNTRSGASPQPALPGVAAHAVA